MENAGWGVNEWDGVKFERRSLLNLECDGSKSEQNFKQRSLRIVLFYFSSQSPKPPSFVFWYHNERMINFGASQELSIHTEPGTGKTHSRLIIR